MMLRRQPRKQKRTGRLRCPGHLAFVRKFHCLVDDPRGCDGPIEAAHWRLGAHAGMGQKPDDTRAIPLCQRHHKISHEIGEHTFLTGYKLDIEKAIAQLCAESPALKRLRAKQRTGT